MIENNAIILPDVRRLMRAASSQFRSQKVHGAHPPGTCSGIHGMPISVYRRV
jgi:hypothetical protein